MTQTMPSLQTFRIDKSLYHSSAGTFSQLLEEMDPSSAYRGTELEKLDAFQRQLKRFDIKVGGRHSDPLEKFFKTSDSAALFPEYVSRAIEQGAAETDLLSKIAAARTEINSLDYRSITSDSRDPEEDYTPIPEGESIPETVIRLNESLVKLKKHGRILTASYEAVRFQRLDVFTVALRQIGAYISRAQLKDAVSVLIGQGDTKAEEIQAGGSALTYGDLLNLWNRFEDFEMNVLLASPDTMVQLLAIPEFQNPLAGLHFQGTGVQITPMGAALYKCGCLPEKTIVALDKRFAFEAVTAGGVVLDYDKLIDRQLERTAVTSIAGFSKLFPHAVKVLKCR